MSSSLLSTLSRSLRGHADDAKAEAPAVVRTLATADAGRSGPTNALEWAHLHRKLEGRPFTLDRHRPLRAIYADPHDHIAIIKPAQRGVSELAINLTGFALDRGAEVWTRGDKDGLNVAYIFPKKEALGDFSKERLSGLARESPYLTSLFGGGDSEFNAVTFKQVRESFLYLRGGWSTSALKSFPADVLILDEYDEMASSAAALARRRLNASSVRRELDISTPSVPGLGIHRMFLDSDQHHYLQPHRCGAWVRYDFLRDVRVRGVGHDAWGEWPSEEIRRHPVTLVCPDCGDAVSDEERVAEGRWEAQEPEVKGLRGYWVPPLAFPSVDLLRLAAAAVNPDPFERQQFFQSDLGLPYTVAGSKISLEQILQLASPLENGALPKGRWSDVTMGIDVGFKKHWKASGVSSVDQRRYALGVGSVDAWADLDGLMRHFRVRRCIVDAQPDLDSAKEFAARWPGRVLRAFYPGPSALKGQLWHMDGLDLKKLRNRRATGRLKGDVVTINRTMAMDRLWALTVKLAEPAPSAVVNDPEFQAHLQSPTRTTMPDTRGQPVSVWLHSGPDHLFHACLVAGTAVMTEHGEIPIEQVRAGMRVRTRRGLRRVRAAGLTARDAEVTAYRFSNGATLTGTPNHPIFSGSRGFVPLHALVYGDIISVWPTPRSSSTKASCFGGIPTALAALIASTTRRGAATVLAASDGSIRRSGGTTTDPSHRGTSSTTGTRIPTITTPTTSSRSRLRAISAGIRSLLVRGRLTWTGSAPSPTPGGARRRVGRGTASTPSAPSPSSSHGTTSATTAAPRSPRDPKPGRTTVGRVRKPVMLRLAALTASMMSLASAWPVGRRSASTATARHQPAPASAVRPCGSVAAGRADVFNLSVEDAEEYFANGLLVHNCVYDLVAAETLPQAAPAFAAAVGGAATAMGHPQPGAEPRRPAPPAGPSRRDRVRATLRAAAGAELRRDYGNPDLPLRSARRRGLVI